MATFMVAAGTDWIAAMQLGSFNDRWRLDDYEIWLHVRRFGDNAILLDLNTDNGKLIIADPVARKLEINVGWSEIDDISPGPFEFDVLFQNKTTGIRSRSGAHILQVTPGITFSEA